MNNIVKETLSGIRENSTKIRYDINLTEEKINLQKQNIEEHKKHNDAEIIKKLEEIKVSTGQLEKLGEDVNLIGKHITVLQNKIGDGKEQLEKKSKKLFQLEAKVETNIKKNRKDIEFYEQNDNCPTCKQSIEQNFKETRIQERKDKVTTQQQGLTEITEELNKITGRMSVINDVIKHISEHNSEIIKHTSTMKAINQYVLKLNAEIKELSTRKVNLDDGGEKLKELQTELDALNKNQEELTIQKQYYDYAATLLKYTGIKTKIIKQYLPIMNKLINKYLTAMDFFVNFNINENFEETIKSRHRDEFSYANFSEGEKMRIDLALLFTWRQIAKLKNSTNTNLLILDEVFDSSLDTVGTEEFLKLIHEMGTDTNVFVISHKGDQLFDKFRSVIKFEKKNNFSRIAK
jgi:DNA repair exonuclease SbcCD ATPase subunit